MKSPMLAAMLNIIPGFGYIYVGGKRRVFGGLLLFGVILSLISTFSSPNYQQIIGQAGNTSSEEAVAVALPTNSLLEIVAGLIVMMAFMFDAHAAAREVNEACDAKIKTLIK